MFHFCSALSKNNYQKIGGFDERYCNGIAYDDNCFYERIRLNGLKIVLRDDLLTYHIEHSRQYISENMKLWGINATLFTRQQATNDFFEKFV
jgi:GT2 family glycosyltransferase